jgi:predicted esterase
LGDTGAGWFSELKNALSNVRIVCPNAPTQPVTLNGGMRMPSWFNMNSLDELLDEKAEPALGMEQSIGVINKIIEREIGLLDGNSGRLIVGGFSQGGALAARVGLSSPKPLAGVVIVSGWPLKWSTMNFSEANRKTPVQCHHGEYDNVVQPQFGAALHQILTSEHFAPDIHWHKTAHSLGDGMGDVKKFVDKCFVKQ